MKKLFVGVLAIAGLVACAQEEVLRTQAPGQIGFDNVYVDNAVRALQGENAADETTKTANLQSFDVWGYMDDVTGVVFDREAVTGGTGNWSYNNIQYWVPGHKYQFYAVAPAQSQNVTPALATDTYNDGLSVTFKNVDGTEDLLYSKSEEIETPTEINAQPAAVQFGFEHLLSKIKFTFVNGIENENAHIKVTNITMAVPAQGTVALNEELKHGYVWADLKDTAILEFGNLNTEDGRVQGYNHAECEVERLTIPAAATQEYTVDFDVVLYMGDKEAASDHKSIKVTNILFESGKAYNLKATLDAANVTDSTLYPITFEATVDEWVEADPYEKDITSPVYTAEELADRLKSNSTNIVAVLQNDIDVAITDLGQQTGGSGEYKLGGKDTKNITIDLNGHKLNITTTYWSALGAKNDDALFTIKNGTMTSTGNSAGTWNAWDLRFSNCNYVFEGVTFEKAVALDNVGKTTLMKNVTITDTHNTDTYGLWITAEGQTVTLEDCVIDMTPASDGRGIKIDNQYVDAADQKKVTLNVTNVTFKTEEKSAILVKTIAGAEINISNVDITAVAADQQFAVWVDEDAAAYANLVVVNGGMVKVEGAATPTVADQAGLADAIANGASTIVLEAGEYTLPKIENASTTIYGTKDVVITVNKPACHGANLTFEGVTVKGSGYSTGVQHVNTVTYKNVAVVGEMCLYGEKVVFDGCTFELAKGQYMWVYAAKVAEFINCEFNTAGKSLLIYNEGAGANNVLVKGCTFNASAGDKAGAIANQNCAAIELDNFQSSGVGAAHTLVSEGNTINGDFSGVWRIKNYVAGNAITVNGVVYQSIAIDGKLMTIDASKNVTVE